MRVRECFFSECGPTSAPPIQQVTSTVKPDGSWQCEPRSGGRMASFPSLSGVFRTLLLPDGYPHSVTPDYLRFQVFDTIQAMSSYLRGLLTTQAILVGVGVGDGTATGTAATIQWVVRDGTGMFGGLLFAWARSSRFGSDVKFWRLFADCINDVGLTLELVSPMFPDYFLALVCLGNLCKAMCGVAAGATRAALTQHFAKSDNVADVSTKESIQETFVTMLGLVSGIWVARALDGSSFGTWTAFVFLTIVHVVANLLAVRSLVLSTLNPQRADLLAKHFIATNQVPGPAEIAREERLLWRPSKAIELGSRARDFFSSSSTPPELPDSRRCLVKTDCRTQTVRTLVDIRASGTDLLHCFFHSRLAAHLLSAGSSEDEIEAALADKSQRGDVELFLTCLTESGWSLSNAHLGFSGWRTDFAP